MSQLTSFGTVNGTRAVNPDFKHNLPYAYRETARGAKSIRSRNDGDIVFHSATTPIASHKATIGGVMEDRSRLVKDYEGPSEASRGYPPSEAGLQKTNVEE
jgi:hypothetical protein